MQCSSPTTDQNFTHKLQGCRVTSCDTKLPWLCRYDGGGAAAGVTTLTSGGGGGGGKGDRRITLAMIKDEGMGAGGATSWVQVCLRCIALVVADMQQL